MKTQRLLIILVIAFFVFFMLGGFGSLAGSSSKVEGRAAQSGQQSPKNEQGESSATPQMDEQDDPDLPSKFRGKIDKEAYLRARDEFVALKRGMEADRPFDLMARGRAISQMERQEKGRRIESMINGSLTPPITTDAAWTPLGPSPLPNGGGTIPVSGRVTTVVVDPTNPNKVYLGAAQGGVWRSLDGGATWVSIFDSAQSLAIGALALAPSDPTKLYVGTGEFNGCGDCFFGVGLYRIDTVDTTPTLVGPINPSITTGSGGGALTYNVFAGRSIGKILVDPTNAANIFVATARGVGGSGGNAFSTLPPMATRGVYRSTNATSAAGSVTFQKLVVNNTDNCFDSPCTGNNDIPDMVMEPGNPNNILVGLFGFNGSSSGVYRTINALAPTPNFSQTLALPLVSGAGVRVELAINKVGSTVTAYAATSEPPTVTPSCSGTVADPFAGAIRKSIDGGATWSGQLAGGQGFCRDQCFYDMPIAVDPTNASLVYIGGQISSGCGRLVGKSIDGGTSFVADSNGLHADEHSLFFDGAGNIYTGNDGGVWKRSSSLAAGSAWTNLNNAPLNTLQFQEIAVHPLDRNLMIGGTQDNGTEYQQTSAGNWSNTEGGDGGYALIDQSATNTTNVTMYHTFYNSANSQIAFDVATLTGCLPNHDSWPERGALACNNGTTLCSNDNNAATLCDSKPFFLNDGIQLSDNVLFYAPMALGPGSPNTVYFGTDRLYRSTDRGDNMAIVSQSPIVPTGTRVPVTGGSAVSVGGPISTIGISPQDDTYRIVGLQNGTVWATSTGSSTLVNITSGSFPANPNGSATNKFVGRAVIDPNNKNVAYIAFSFFAPAGQGVWKITNLGAAASASPSAAVWTAAGNGIPSIPINALAIDPANSNNIFAGTDIGVYNSTDGGANWVPFGAGLPRSAVFDLALQNANRILRAGTHGRGVWEISIAAAAPAVQFSSSTYSVTKGDPNNPRVNITVNRSGDTTGSASVGYATIDDAGLQNCNVFNGTASPRCDYENTQGTLTWAAGDATPKTFSVAIVADSYAKGTLTFRVGLSNASGVTLTSPSIATVTIFDNPSVDGPNNPIDNTNFFVRQQYLDFLGREPDPPGFAGWTNTINNCSGDTTQCDRIHVSQLFFQSAEFQDRGYFVYRFYPVAFGRKPDYSEFVPDLASVSGFLDANQLEAAKVAFIAGFMARPAFASTYNPLTNQQYVDMLLNTAGVTMSSRQAMIDGLNNSTMTRGQVLRQIVESTEVSTKYNHQAYAVMEYFGYLRRQPDSFYLQWIAVLDATNDPRGMVTGFVNSAEYRNRFGP
jgi:hypothetical protein